MYFGKRLLSDLRAGEICRDVEKSKKRDKEKNSKELLPGRFLHNSGSSARYFHTLAKDYFSQENCRLMQLLKSGLRVVVSISQLGNSAKVSGTRVCLKPWWAQEVAGGHEKYLSFTAGKKETTKA